MLQNLIKLEEDKLAANEGRMDEQIILVFSNKKSEARLLLDLLREHQ